MSFSLSIALVLALVTKEPNAQNVTISHAVAHMLAGPLHWHCAQIYFIVACRDRNTSDVGSGVDSLKITRGHINESERASVYLCDRVRVCVFFFRNRLANLRNMRKHMGVRKATAPGAHACP